MNFYSANVVFYSDYYPFGMLMPNRYTGNSKYRYSFNGMEKDNEISGDGNSFSTHFRQYDPRIARWTSIDPLAGKFPWQSPYVGFDNNPIYYSDPSGAAASNPQDPPKTVTLKEVTITADAPAKHVQRAARYAINNNIDYSKVQHGESFSIIDISTYEFDGYAVNSEGDFQPYYKRNEKYLYFYAEGEKAKSFDRPVPDPRKLFSGTTSPNVYHFSDLAHFAMAGVKQLEFKGYLLASIVAEPEIQNDSRKALSSIMTDKRYGKETFSVNIADYMVQFGPPRGEGVPGYLDPATSVNTWTVRHAMVRAEAIIQMNGTIHLKYHVQDIWDVRPSDNKGTAYNTVTTPLGFVWHDVVGASEPLIKANWIIRYTPSNGQINYE